MKNSILITSASVIPQDLKPVLEDKVSKLIGIHPIEYHVDQTLIAGLQISFGDTQYHYDLKSKIEYLVSELIQ